jgi:hypothetical protein
VGFVGGCKGDLEGYDFRLGGDCWLMLEGMLDLTVFRVTGGEVRLAMVMVVDGGGNGISQFDFDIINNIPSIDVPMKTLDSFNLTNINFIKIDVEGHEKEVLEGSIETLKRNNYPKILFESWDPEQVTEEAMVIEGLKHLFITQTVDQRIEEATSNVSLAFGPPPILYVPRSQVENEARLSRDAIEAAAPSSAHVNLPFAVDLGPGLVWRGDSDDEMTFDDD